MTQWSTLEDWQVVRARDNSNSHIDTIKSVWEKGRPLIIPTVNPFEILNSTSTQSGDEALMLYYSGHMLNT